MRVAEVFGKAWDPFTACRPPGKINMWVTRPPLVRGGDPGGMSEDTVRRARRLASTNKGREGAPQASGVRGSTACVPFPARELAVRMLAPPAPSTQALNTSHEQSPSGNLR
jgi:hypothetical protein